MYSSRTLEVLDISNLSGITDADIDKFVHGKFMQDESVRVDNNNDNKKGVHGSINGDREEKERRSSRWGRRQREGVAKAILPAGSLSQGCVELLDSCYFIYKILTLVRHEEAKIS